MKKIYIAGFDVFKPNSTDIGKEYKSLCMKYGFKGMYPLDNIVDFTKEPHKIAQQIFDANKHLIDEADIVIANLNPFRGKEPDSGTVWECGYASGLGKKVYGYASEGKDYIKQFSDNETHKPDPMGGVIVDSNNMTIEDFGHPFNLMIACSVEKTIIGGFEDALKELKNAEQ